MSKHPISELMGWFSKNLNQIKENYNPVPIEILVKELSEKDIIDERTKQQIEKFSERFDLEEIIKNTTIMTLLITVANATTGFSYFIPNGAGMIYMYSQVPRYIKKKRNSCWFIR